MRRFAALVVVVLLPLTASAQSDDEPGTDVIDVSGPLDALALDFVIESIESAAADGQLLALIQIDSPAVLDGEGYDRLIALLEAPPLPVAAWVGPAPASALGGVHLIVHAAGQRAMAPGAVWGVTNPVVLGEEREEVIGPTEPLPAEELESMELQPTLRQYLQDLDGRTFETAGGPVTVSTLKDFEDGVTLRQVTLRKPGLATRFFRLAVTPEATFFFLVVGLTVASFEFYALGPGVAAGVAAVSLLLAGWGIVTLPVRWWAVALVVAGWALLTMSHQRGRPRLPLLAGVGFLQVGGMLLIDGRGQLDPNWWLILLSVLAVLFFFLIAMPTVQRARLSTMTVGRDSMVGLTGKALGDFDPDGLVEVDGGRWRATAHREAGLVEGSEVVVTGVDGLYLEVKSAKRET
ncbi:MAG: NfeD family protein [Acidimicrobiia bacterium]